MSLMHLLFSFEGRIRRSQWWLAKLGLWIAACVLAGVTRFTIAPAGYAPGAAPQMSPAVGLVCLVILAAMAWMSLALDVKRWHDRNKSGWFVLVALIPVIGVIWILVELGFLEGAHKPNRYGPPPHPERGAAPVHA